MNLKPQGALKKNIRQKISEQMIVLKNSKTSFIVAIFGLAIVSLANNSGAARESIINKAINAQSLCGTWQTMPRSGGFHQLKTSNGKTKDAGYNRGSVKYTITDANLRTLVAVQTIDLSTTHSHSVHMNGKFTSNATRNLVGVTRQDSVLFSVQDEPSTEQWNLLSPGIYEVTGSESGPHAMAYYFLIKQTSKSACSAD